MKKIFKHNLFTAEFNDENGYFSLTGHINHSCGAVSAKIADIDERFRLLDEMHLASCETGQPMYCLENGFYHYKNAKPKTYPAKFKALENYCNIELTKEDKDLIIFSGSRKKKACIKDIIKRHQNEYLEKVQAVYDLVESIPSDLREGDEYFDIEDCNEPEKVQALADFLGCDPSIIEEESDEYFEAEGCNYRVLTDEEADTAWDEYLENYIDECLEIPERVENYFDREAWKNDARMDGRGHCLSSWDGNENESNGLYIYQQ